MRHCWNNSGSRERVARWVVGVVLTLTGAPVAHAAGAPPELNQILVDPTFRNQPAIGISETGVAIIAINAPSSAGVSFNAFKAFGVGKSGVIFNNSPRPTGAELVHFLRRNQNFAGRSARIIVSEVTGNQPSVLNGNIEVAGVRADVVIANPNGITCSGCGFIFTDRVVLTTGRPAFSGNIGLESFIVFKGEINVEGLIAPDLARLDLIGRKVNIKGDVRAVDVGVTSGANQVRYLTMRARTDGGQDIENAYAVGARPSIGIDVAALGGIYANKIRLLSTEKGTGVRVAGKLVSSVGDLELASAGGLNMEGTLSSKGALLIRASGPSVLDAPVVLPVAGTGIGSGGPQLGAGGGAAGGSQVAGGGTGAGGPQVAGGGVAAGGAQGAGGGAGAGGSQAAGGGVAAGRPQVAGGGVAAGRPQVAGGGVAAGGAQGAGGGAGAGGSPVAGGGVAAGRPQVAGGGAASGRPSVAGGGVRPAIPALGTGEAGQLAGAPEPEVEIIKVTSTGTRPEGRIQEASVTPHPTLIRPISSVYGLPFAMLFEYLKYAEVIITKALVDQKAKLFTLPRVAPGTTIERVDEGFEEQRLAGEQLLPERRHRSYDARDFGQGHGVLSTSATDPSWDLVVPVATGEPG